MSKPILPGATIGILGSGQLGRMLAQSARQMGYRVSTLSPEKDSPTGQIADHEVVADYSDLDAIEQFARAVDVVTFEFENVASEATAAAAKHAPVRPDGQVLHITQNRLREKQALSAAGLPLTPFAPVTDLASLEAAITKLGCPAILKTAGFGYDGKGQVRINQASEASAAWAVIGAQAAVLEQVVDFELELSVVAARGLNGQVVDYGLIENRHSQHILDLSIADLPLSAAQTAAAHEIAHGVLESLGVVGVLCVELFLTKNGDLLINEVAPRPHNSGHLTIEGCPTGQFAQQLRAVCGLPLGDTTRHCAVAMANLLGDLWQVDGRSQTPDWSRALANPRVNLHLYGKAKPRPGRKMGHITALAATREEAAQSALAARAALLSN
ncbi:MAG: 5-(carboxyamino)imidazole ribonucleotide synthase [Gammaproteobacteria bacterium]|nr:5-(carboxyamino)imidazole ribonucleotide synthase [Gammaproteobacteria bacterium]